MDNRNVDPINELLWQRRRLTGRLFWPYLMEPDAKSLTADGTPKYKVMVAWQTNDPKNAAVVQEMQQTIEKVRQAKNPNIPPTHFIGPIKTWGINKRQDGQDYPEYLTGHSWINFTTKNRPILVEQTPAGIIETFDPAALYAGRNCAIEFTMFHYSQQKKGVSCGFKGVCLLPGGDMIDVGGGVVTAESLFGDMGQVYTVQTQNNAGGHDASSII